MSPEVLRGSEASREEQPQEPQDPETALTPEERDKMLTKIAARPGVALSQFFRQYHDQFLDRQCAIGHRVNDTTGFPPDQMRAYEQLTGVLSMIREMAERIGADEQAGTHSGAEDFTASMALLREAEQLIGTLDRSIAESDPSWLTYEQGQRQYGMNAMLANGLATDLMKDGKHPDIQSLVVPDNVSVSLVSGVDFQTVASESDVKNGTAFNPYARKIPQFRKAIHLKIPAGQIPRLTFEWKDPSTGQETSSTVTGRRRTDGAWIFYPSMPEAEEAAPVQENVQERSWGRRRGG
jgi:hypothetical protein